MGSPREDDDALWHFIGGLIAASVSILLLMLFRGYVLVKMWTWFVVPLGVVGIGLAHAIGISTIITFLTHKPSSEEREDERSLTAKIVAKSLEGVFIIGFMWAIGAAVHAFM